MRLAAAHDHDLARAVVEGVAQRHPVVQHLDPEDAFGVDTWDIRAKGSAAGGDHQLVPTLLVDPAAVEVTHLDGSGGRVDCRPHHHRSRPDARSRL